MDRVTDLKKALDGEMADEERFDLGVLCQFSIPIITICALIVLMIIVCLLNIVFFWMPFFRICLPDPAEVAAMTDAGAILGRGISLPAARRRGRPDGVVEGEAEHPRGDPGHRCSPSPASGCGWPEFGGGLDGLLFEPNTTPAPATRSPSGSGGRSPTGSRGCACWASRSTPTRTTPRRRSPRSTYQLVATQDVAARSP